MFFVTKLFYFTRLNGKEAALVFYVPDVGNKTTDEISNVFGDASDI